MNYINSKAKAKAMLTKFGTASDIKLKKFISQQFNEETMETENVYEEYSGAGVYLNYSEEAIGRNDNVIQAGDVKIICIFDAMPSETEDQIIFNNEAYNVVHVKKLSPDGKIDILYTVQCRKA